MPASPSGHLAGDVPILCCQKTTWQLVYQTHATSLFLVVCASGGIRTHTVLSDQGILSPSWLPLHHRGSYFNELTLSSWGDSNPASISCFRGRHSTIELQDFLLFGGYCKSSSLNHSGTTMDCHRGF